MLGTVLVVVYIVVPTVIQRGASWNNVPYRYTSVVFLREVCSRKALAVKFDSQID